MTEMEYWKIATPYKSTCLPAGISLSVNFQHGKGAFPYKFYICIPFRLYIHHITEPAATHRLAMSHPLKNGAVSHLTSI